MLDYRDRKAEVMIDGMESFVGRQLNQKAIEEYGGIIGDMGHLLTRPNDCGENIHINMMIYFDKDYVITNFEGDKCYSYNRGLYNRSSKVTDRPFSKKDIAYLKRFVKEITK